MFKCNVHVPHEAIDEDVRGDNDLRGQLQYAVDNEQLPKCYYMHPVVLSAFGELVLPCAIFIDGLPYSLNDSVIGFWLVNLLTGCRYLLGTLRKKFACQCGCRGWCTFFEIFNFLAWSVQAMDDGRYPSQRHSSSNWFWMHLDTAFVRQQC